MEPVNKELFKRTAPKWNCVAYPGEGMHYVPGNGDCLWCGKTREQIKREQDDNRLDGELWTR